MAAVVTTTVAAAGTASETWVDFKLGFGPA